MKTTYYTVQWEGFEAWHESQPCETPLPRPAFSCGRGTGKVTDIQEDDSKSDSSGCSIDSDNQSMAACAARAKGLVILGCAGELPSERQLELYLPEVDVTCNRTSIFDADPWSTQRVFFWTLCGDEWVYYKDDACSGVSYMRSGDDGQDHRICQSNSSTCDAGEIGDTGSCTLAVPSLKVLSGGQDQEKCTRSTSSIYIQLPSDANNKSNSEIDESGGQGNDIYEVLYNVQWKTSDGRGSCEASSPSIQLQCGGGGGITPLVNSDGGCAVHDKDLSQATCAAETGGNVRIKCQGEEAIDLELTATLDRTDVSCSGLLDMTCKGNCEGMAYFGGSASQMIQLHTLCNNEWTTFEDDACSVDASSNAGWTCSVSSSCSSFFNNGVGQQYCTVSLDRIHATSVGQRECANLVSSDVGQNTYSQASIEIRESLPETPFVGVPTTSYGHDTSWESASGSRMHYGVHSFLFFLPILLHLLRTCTFKVYM